MPDGTSRFSYKGQAIAHYMGCSTFSNYTVLPEIALAKIRKDAPFDKACYVGCGVTTGVGRGGQHGQGRAGRERRGLRPGRHRAERHPGAEDGRGRHDRRRRHQPDDKEEWGRRFGMTHFVNPKDVSRRRGASGRADRRRRGLHLRLHRQHDGHAPGAGGLPPRLGREHRHRRGRGGQGDLHPPLPAGHRPGLARARPSAARAAAPTRRASSTGIWTARSRSIR